MPLPDFLFHYNTKRITLKRGFFQTMELTVKHNFAITNYVHYGMFVMTIQADAVRKLDGSPIVVLVGPAGRGKTTAQQLAMVCPGQLLEQVYHYLKSSILIPWV